VLLWVWRFTLAAVLALGLGYLPYRAYGPKGVARALRLEEDLERLDQRNTQLREDNLALRRKIRALKAGDDAVERTAREDLGLVKPEDLVFIFHHDRRGGP